jgi:hypothetical protein
MPSFFKFEYIVYDLHKQMNQLKDRPNLLFLIFIRGAYNLLIIPKLRRPIYRAKTIKALTIIKTYTGKDLKDNSYFPGYPYNDDFVIRSNMKKIIKYMVNGKLHREDGPAISIYGNELLCEAWFRNNLIHRDGAPAVYVPSIIFPDYMFKGSTEWYQNGKLHRDGGPALESEFSIGWYQNGEIHRDDGPAYAEIANDRYEQRWFKHSKIHRDGGPAIISFSDDNDDKSEYWFQHGLEHREDGPAQTEIIGDQTLHRWFLSGVEYDENLNKIISQWRHMDHENN